jgi:Fe-S-cluster containining protein
VYLTLDDRRRLARTLGLPTATFTRRYCENVADEWRLRDAGPDCTFLKDQRCSVYEGRPTQCRTWPFWPENMSTKKWTAVAAFCPGVGKGPVIPRERIEAILAEQRDSTARQQAP